MKWKMMFVINCCCFSVAFVVAVAFVVVIMTMID